MNIEFLMWACEVIMVCGKRWVVDCGVCVLVDQILFFAFLRMYTLVFTLDVLLQFCDAIVLAMLFGWILLTHNSCNDFQYYV